jgi:TRAP transporter 4TM/12TM fusion protein
VSEVNAKAWRNLIASWLGVIGETRRVRPGGLAAVVEAGFSATAVVIIGWIALFGLTTQHLQVSIFLLLLLPIGFLTTTANSRLERLTPVDYLFALVSFATAGWFAWNESRYAVWMSGFSVPTDGDKIFGTILLLLCLELCRRTVGVGLTIIVLLLLLYVALGHHLVGSIWHSPVGYNFFIEMQVVGTDGVFGAPLYVAASYAFLFVLFGNFYVLSGGGQLFFDVAAALTGRMVGGPAKACVISSGLYGMISGSPVADVATTGPITIPVMKRIGIPAERAGAIEAASSCGGALLPPVMGAVAFIMSDFTGIPYFSICKYALLPAIVYYLGVFTLVHFEAARLNLGRVPETAIVGIWTALARNWSRIIPIVVLIWLLIDGYSPTYIAAGSTVSVIVASWLSRADRIGPRRFIEGCVSTCSSMVPLVAAVAAAGIIIASIEMTGLAEKFTLLLFQLSGGYLIPSLVLAGVILLLFGMGMPTIGVYITGIAILAPVFIGKFGLPILNVHMFILFYSCMSAITPPVAVAAFAAAAIAGANPFKLAPYACKLAAAGFILPYYFMFNDGILVQGDFAKIISDTAIGIALVLTLAVALHGFLQQRRIPVLMRLSFALAAIAMMAPIPAIQYSAAAAAGGIFLFLRKATQTGHAYLR